MLFKLRELSDLYADACVRDESGQLMFLSLYGRDTAIQQLLAAFTLKVREGGLNSFHLQDPDGQAQVVHVGNADRLEKFTGKLPRDNLFGNLVHVWLYDPALIRPDRSNRVAWVLVDGVHHEATRSKSSGSGSGGYTSCSRRSRCWTPGSRPSCPGPGARWSP